MNPDPLCHMCNDTGRTIAQRVEPDHTTKPIGGKEYPIVDRRTDWVVACSCPAGDQWRDRLAPMPPRLKPQPSHGGK